MTPALMFLILCPLVFLAGFIDAVAGGGGLISLPAYMLVGLSPHHAIATNKMSSTMGTTVATIKYAKNGFIPWKQVVPGIVCAILGSTLGANIALRVSDEYFRYILLVALPVTAFYVMRTKKLSGDKERLAPRIEYPLIMMIAFALGIYDGFYGPGTGTFLILLLTGAAHMKLTEANGLTKAINLTTNVSALVVYLMNGQVLLLYGLTAGVCNIAGNYLGATCFQKGGTKFTKPVMLIVLVIFFIKLLLNK